MRFPTTAAVTVLLALVPMPGMAQDGGAFSGMGGSWSGGGTISMSNGARERLRCRANHSVGDGGRRVSINVRCASDSYQFNLSSNLVARRGRISGNWSESSNGVSGSLSGSGSGGRIRATATSSSFTAGLAITTSGGRQTVSITPLGQSITSVQISLRRG